MEISAFAQGGANYISRTTVRDTQGHSYMDVDYYDGLGYKVQHVEMNGSNGAGAGCVVTQISYDNMRRDDARVNLPYASTGSGFKTDAQQAQQLFYSGRYGQNGGYAYSENVYDSSVEGRVRQVWNPGPAFRSAERSTEIEYRLNLTDDGVRRMVWTSAGIDARGLCPQGSLTCVQTTNGDGARSLTFSDVRGRTVLKRRYADDGVNCDTYFCYDLRDSLVMVIQPEGSSRLSGIDTIAWDSEFARSWCFVYQYDGYGRLVRSRTPGAGLKEYIYDARGRIVLSRDGNLRGKSLWIRNIYDRYYCLRRKEIVNTAMTIEQLNASDIVLSGGDTSECTVVAVLEEHQYDRSGFVPTVSYPTGHLPEGTSPSLPDVVHGWDVCCGKFIVSDESCNINCGILYAAGNWTLGDTEYLDESECLNEEFLLYSDSSTGLKYYYIPSTLEETVNLAVDEDPTGYLSISSELPAGAFNAESLTTPENIPPTLSFAAIPGTTGRPLSFGDLGSSLNFMNYEKIAVLGPEGQYGIEGYVERAFYYDKLGRTAQIVEKNHTGGISRTSMIYDLLGNIEQIVESVGSGNGTGYDTKVIKQQYDSRGRICSETVDVHLSNGRSAGTEVEYEYDELGRILHKYAGYNREGIGETYGYTMQGQLAAKSVVDMYQTADDIFSMTLSYENPSEDGVVPSYTGRISSETWVHGYSDPITYSFEYDTLGRFEDSRMLTADGGMSNSFCERGIEYDRNGNILRIDRYGASGSTPESSFEYLYSGNRMTSVSVADETYSYCYDENGNMTFDSRRSVVLEYNVLNLPSRIGNIEGRDTLWNNFRYLADGTKVASIDSDGNGSSYLGSFIYLTESGEYSFFSTAFSSGRFMSGIGRTGDISTLYYVTDHLGSIRAIAEEGTGRILERDDYYPFGKRHDNSGMARLDENRYRFNGKEEIEGCGLIDGGKRIYDPEIARWNSIDPEADRYEDSSPYAYCLSDPINLVDPQGDKVVILFSNKDQGHLAILIQHSDGKYYLYSKNGNKTGEGTILTKKTSGYFNQCAGKSVQTSENSIEQTKNDPYCVDASPQAFMDNPTHNQHPREKDGKVYYTEGYIIDTQELTGKQSIDQDIANTMTKLVENGSSYNLFTDNCAQAVYNSLHENGIQCTSFTCGGLEYVLPSCVYRNIKLSIPGTVIKPSAR